MTSSYSGVIQDSRTVLLASSITSEIASAKRKVKVIFISLNSATYTDNKSVAMMVKQINLLSQKIGVPIALIDYSDPLYQLLKVLTKSTKIKLFKNIRTARLFLDAKSFKKGLSILVYDEDELNSKSLSKELLHFEYTVVVAKNADDYRELMHKKHFDIIITQSTLNADIENAKSSATALPLSKKLIANLPLFMDTAVETLVSFTGMEAKKSAHSIQRFDINMNTSAICAVMRFRGDLEGSFVLVFPKDIAIITMESLLGEKVDENDTKSLMDGVGEFCNIITGSTKMVLSNKGIKVLFDLPKKYTSLQATLDNIGDFNGIWVDMQLASKPFYMFITK